MPDGFTCPSPLGDHSHVQLAHGGGGRLTNALIEGMFAPAFDPDEFGLRNSNLEGISMEQPEYAELDISFGSWDALTSE